MFYFNSYKVEMELVTPWFKRRVSLGFLILLSVLVYSAILHLFPPVLMLPTIFGISCLIGLIVLVKTYGVK